MKHFKSIRSWRRTALAAPFLEHHGVRVFHVLHREGWPLEYHFSWRTTRADGDRNLPGEVFDIRQLPDYFERPGLEGKPELATVRQWRKEHWADRETQIRWFIDRCFEIGIEPWSAPRRRMLPGTDFAIALRRDLSALYSYWFPSADERMWREGDTHLGTHFTVTRMPKGVVVLEIEGSHWKEGWGGPRLRQEYPLATSARTAVAQYRKFASGLFGRAIEIRSAHVVCSIGESLPREEFSAWADEYRQALGLSVHRIEPILCDGGFDHVLRAGDCEESLQRTLDFCGYLVDPLPEPPPSQD